jgi:hypothetical protein
MVELLKQAEGIIDAELLAPSTQRAIIAALQAAGADRVKPEHFISAAKAHRAKVRVVAAGCGWARCEHCGQWRAIGEAPSEDLSECACTLEIEDEAVFWALALYIYCGGPVAASISLPASVTERAKRFEQSTGGLIS